MSKDDFSILSSDKYIEQIAVAFVNEALDFLNKQETRWGDTISDRIAMDFLAGFVTAVLYAKLTKTFPEGTSKEEIYKISQKRYLELKTEIQNSVAVGVQSAMYNYSGVFNEYYCQVKLVPEPANKKLC